MSNNVKGGHKNKQSYANTRTTGKEQFYTDSKIVDLCLAEVKKHIDLTGEVILEPCGGTGEFVSGFLRAGIPEDKIVSYDIEPKHPMVKQGNYLETDFDYKDYVSITNPPFGRMSSLARDFFGHAATHSKYICYLIPKSWRKWTIQNSLNKNFHLIADVDLPKNCFYLPDGTKNEKDVLNTVFQIWERREYKRKKIEIPDNKLIKKLQPTKKLVTVYQKEKTGLFKFEDGEFIPVEQDYFKKTSQKRPDKIKGANFEIIQFGHSSGKCKELDPTLEYEAKTTTMYLKIDRQDVKDFLMNHDYSQYYNNVAYVSALSIAEINYELNEWFGLENFKF
jgi:hypothetical protein